MESVFAEVLSCSWGTTRFDFAADGGLVEISIRTGQELGCRGKRPAGAPSSRALRAWLRDYEAGGGQEFPGAWDVPGASEFRRAVYRVVAAIPVGTTLSYGEVAAAVGSPGASRAVGTAMGQNSLPLIVP
jgi:O6-methylguanine-DNA--protein-cysteine methyltransferase